MKVGTYLMKVGTYVELLLKVKTDSLPPIQ